MGKITDFLAGIKILEEVESPLNGKITVVKSLAFGTYLQVGGLTQSGGIIKSIWNKTLKVVSSQKLEVRECLILGLGGGSIVEVIRKYWPDVRITAVDIDPLMVKLGKKYLGFDNKKVEVVISDAFEYLSSHISLLTSYHDLICVDLYVGDEFPEKFESVIFLENIKKILGESGRVVFNRLYYGKKRPQSVKFASLLEKVFSRVDVVYPEANVMFVCFK